MSQDDFSTQALQPQLGDLALHALDATGIGFITFRPDGSILTANASAQRMFHTQADEIRSCSLYDFLSLSRDETAESPDMEAQIRAWADAKGRIELTGHRKNNKTFPVELSINRLPTSGDAQYVGILQDITDRKRAEERLTQLAQYDELTGLANRSLFRDTLVQALARADRSKGYAVVMFLDLDHFKRINDTLGHDAGDELLKETAGRLVQCVRRTDTVARQGGDEFTIILEEARDFAVAAKIAAKILETMSEPFMLQDNEFYVTTSIGIASYPESGNDADSLTKAADTAMYQAKADGRNNYKFFDPDMNSASQVRLALEADLRHAINRGELRLFYQPQVNLKTGRVDGCEALIRWIHPHRGLVPPDDFIPIAEDTGIILDIGEWVIHEAARTCKTWVEHGHTDMKVAVNISPHQFRQKSIKKIIMEAVANVSLDSKHLELEITEGHLMDNTEESINLMQELSDFGFAIAMDDFGTGYSSLAYLKQFALGILKIDRSFVMDLPHDPDAVSICEAIISMAHSLGLEVIAEGVESEEHLEFMQNHGCQYVQGYYVSKPLPGDEFLAWIDENQQYLPDWERES